MSGQRAGRVACVVAVVGVASGCAETVSVPVGAPYPNPQAATTTEVIERYGAPALELQVVGEDLEVHVFRPRQCSAVERQQMLVQEQQRHTPASKRRNWYLGASAVVATGIGVAMAVSKCPEVSGLANDGNVYNNECLPQDESAQGTYNAVGGVLIGGGVGLGAFAIYNILQGGKKKVVEAEPNVRVQETEDCGSRPAVGAPVQVNVAETTQSVMTDYDGVARVRLLGGRPVSSTYLRHPFVKVSVTLDDGQRLEASEIVQNAEVIAFWTEESQLADEERNRRWAERKLEAVRRLREMLRSCVGPWTRENAACVEELNALRAQAADWSRAEGATTSQAERAEVAAAVAELEAWTNAQGPGLERLVAEIEAERSRAAAEALRAWQSRSGYSSGSSASSGQASGADISDAASLQEKHKAYVAECIANKESAADFKNSMRVTGAVGEPSCKEQFASGTITDKKVERARIEMCESREAVCVAKCRTIGRKEGHVDGDVAQNCIRVSRCHELDCTYR